MKQITRHILSLVLTCAMLLSLFPVVALAEEPENTPNTAADTLADPAPVNEPESEPAKTVYVSEAGNDETGNGLQKTPYASLAKAVSEINNDTNTSNFIIEVESDLDANVCARIADKHVTINGNGHTITRTDGFSQIQDNARSTYNPAMIEVTVPAGKGASVTLENVTLDDAGRYEGTIFTQANSSGDPSGNSSCVQDAMIAAYGTDSAQAKIILGSGATLKNFGGMSAVRVIAGASLTMEEGSVICDDTVKDRIKGASGSIGPVGAVWVQGTGITMNDGAVIRDIVGRAVCVDGGSATISGDIFNIKADADMWQGTAGLAVHGRGDSDITLTASCEIRDFNTSANQGSAVGIYSSDLDMQNGAIITNIKGTMALYMDDMGKDYQHTALVNGTVEKVENNPVMRSWYGHIEIGPTGVVQDCVSSAGLTDGQVLYTNNGSKYTIRGKILNNKGTVLYIANQSGGRPEVTMEEGAEISGTKGAGLLGGGVAVRVNNGSLFTMNGGTISDNSTGVQVSGKDAFKGVEFVMNGGTISGNSTGISYTVQGESKVRLNGGTISDNGTTYQIYAPGGSADDVDENIYIKSGVLQGNTTVYTSFGTLTLDEAYPSLWLGTASSTAKSQIEALVKAGEDQANWAVKGNALWFKADSETLPFSMPRPYSVDKGIGLHVGYIPLKDDGTPADGATLTLLPLVNSETLDVTLTDLTPGTSYALAFVAEDKYYVTINPADITVYEIDDVLVDGKSIGAVSSYTFENVKEKHTISVSFRQLPPTPNDTGVSDWLNTKDHLAYLQGFPNGCFGPSQNMTRAEAAQMFYNLLLDKDVTQTVTFSDVPADAWYADAVNTLASIGILEGVGGDRFEPTRVITRAEFTAIGMRFGDLCTEGENIFSDVDEDDWFYDVVVGSIQYGWINGFTDGTFRPYQTITRAEVTVITNRMLGRSADEDYVDEHGDQLRKFCDVDKDNWAYYDIAQATNAHEYVKSGSQETWES